MVFLDVVEMIVEPTNSTSHKLYMAYVTVNDIYQKFGVTINELLDLRILVVCLGMYDMACFDVFTVVTTFTSTSKDALKLQPIGT